MKSKIKETSRVLRALQSQFRLLLPASLQASPLAVDMADIHEICWAYLSYISDILRSNAANRKGIEDTLYKIDCELFEHLPFHLRSLKKMLPQAIHAIQRTSKDNKVLSARTERGKREGRRKSGTVSRPPVR